MKGLLFKCYISSESALGNTPYQNSLLCAHTSSCISCHFMPSIAIFLTNYVPEITDFGLLQQSQNKARF